MNELRFLEIMGKIDDDLIRGAMSDAKQKESRVTPKRNIFAFGSVAAAAVITVGSVAFYNAHKPSDLLADHSVIEQDISHKDDENSNNQGVPATTSGGKESAITTAHTQKNTASTTQADEHISDTHIAEDSSEQQTVSAKNTDTSDVIEPPSTKAPSKPDVSHTTQTAAQTELPVQGSQKVQTSQPAETVTTTLPPVQSPTEEPTDFDDLPYAVHTDLDVSYEEAKEKFGHAVSECTRSDFLGYTIGIVSQNGDIDSEKAFCYDVAYKFINGTIAVIDQDKMSGSRATYGPLQYDYRDRIFQDETFINDEQITIGYYPDGDSGLAYVAVFDRSADIYEIMDLIISLEI